MNQKRFNITIHGIDASVYRRIEERAKREGLQPEPDDQGDTRGVARSERARKDEPVQRPVRDAPAVEAARLLAAERDFERVDPEDWR